MHLIYLSIGCSQLRAVGESELKEILFYVIKITFKLIIEFDFKSSRKKLINFESAKPFPVVSYNWPQTKVLLDFDRLYNSISKI